MRPAVPVFLVMLGAATALQPAAAVERPANSARMKAPPAVAAPTVRPVSAESRRIATFLVPQSAFVDGNISGFRLSFKASLEKDSASKAMLMASPGLADAIASAAEAKLATILNAEYPGLIDQIAGVIGANLQAGDYAPVMAFLKSSAGSKLIAAAYGQKAQEVVADRMGGRGDSADIAVTDQDVSSVTLAAQNEAFRQMTSQEIRLLAEFGASPAGRRFGAIRKTMNELTLTWVNDLIGRRMADINEVVLLTVKAHLENNK